MGKLDGPHVFLDGYRELVPASLLKARNNRRIGTFRSSSFKLGPAHSHDTKHVFHILEDLPNAPETILKKFRKRVKSYRDERRERRDR